MTQNNKRRGGRRPGSGRHRRRIYLNDETAKTLAELLRHQRHHLNRPELTADEVVRDLIVRSNEQRRTISVEATMLVQEVFQRKWTEMVQRLINEIRSQFDSMYAEMMLQVQEEIARKWMDGDSNTGNEYSGQTL